MEPTPAEAVRKVLNRRWHEPILRCLMSNPLRYSEIRDALLGRVGQRLGDGYLSEELKTLSMLGLVARQTVPGRQHHVWALTGRGEDVVALLDGLTGR